MERWWRTWSRTRTHRWPSRGASSVPYPWWAWWPAS
uniref:Uncharacterized protein n=1 Tax=Arundo donax TaxID=35708 RepID=A0A0A9FZ45_ARUDO